jgi:hypothetical protein
MTHTRYGLFWIASALAAIIAVCAGCEGKKQPEGSVSSGGAPVIAPGQQTFASPDAAVNALVGALRPFDEGRLRAVLGPDAGDIISSGDKVADSNQLDTFFIAYDRKHRIDMTDNDTATLLVGEGDWPLPIPIVREGNAWVFDTDSGKDEILARRVGRNELDTIQTMRAIVDAQDDYAETDPMKTGVQIYAQKFFSDPGTHDGLYWEAQPGEPQSPLGDLVAEAVSESYTTPTAETRANPQPFHGYLYRMLTAQGDAAPGGARSYIEGDRMIGGFGVIAWPASYGNSGVMTFIINQNGILYQKDLGDNTAELAKSMTAFNPSEGWEVVP